MRPFELVSTDKLDVASKEASRGGVIKAAGIDLLDRLKERIESPKLVIDILPQKQLAKITTDGADVHIGALVTLDDIEHAKELASAAFDAVREAAATTATPQIRNRATLGGNLLQTTRCWYLRSAGFTCLHDGKGTECLAMNGENRYHSIMGFDDCVRVHPSNMAPAVLAMGADVVIHGPKGERRMPAAKLYPEEPDAEGPEHTLAKDEILTRVIFKKPAAGTRSAYAESREKMSHDWATTSAAVRLVVTDGVIRDATICLGCVAPVPILATEAAKQLIGKKANAKLFATVSDTAFAKAEPLEHNGYKVAVGKAVLVDALTLAATQ